MIRIATVLFVLASLAAACATVDRKAALGPASDPCLDVGSDCTNSSACCSMWCVNGTCERKDP
jgi:hypothetical protein